MYLPRKQLPLIALCLAAVIFAVFLSMENDSWIGIALLLFFGALPALVLTCKAILPRCARFVK